MKRILLATLLVVLSCKAERGPLEKRAAGDPQAQVAESAERAPQSPATSEPAKTQALTRMIIRDAKMSLVVRDAADVLQKVTVLVDAKGGYVAESREWKESEQVRASATLRVPATQLMPLLAAIRGLAIRVESENVTAQDVSQEYSDLGAQLRNLQATETELRELLKTVRERTQKASEIMEIYTEITKVRGDIDRIQGRIQYLSQMTSLSTVTLEITPDVLAAPIMEPGWQPVATVKNASRSLVNSLKGVVDVLIWVVLYILPLGLIFVVLALIVRAVWRRLRKLHSSTV
ncbi:MAG TPA: DUF4349 domain-containing protein [Thermoanaerobaculia bacterium]|jgi:hypothetical protein|nr:DUF4349 domain-containing protein [Thermoanaerobaculia bacterium]